MKRNFIVMICAMLTLMSASASAKTLVVYYSYTNNCREIVTTLTSQIEADVLEIQPAEKGLKYEANGYALGTQLNQKPSKGIYIVNGKKRIAE